MHATSPRDDSDHQYAGLLQTGGQCMVLPSTVEIVPEGPQQSM